MAGKPPTTNEDYVAIQRILEDALWRTKQAVECEDPNAELAIMRMAEIEDLASSAATMAASRKHKEKKSPLDRD